MSGQDRPLLSDWPETRSVGTRRRIQDVVIRLLISGLLILHLSVLLFLAFPSALSNGTETVMLGALRPSPPAQSSFRPFIAKLPNALSTWLWGEDARGTSEVQRRWDLSQLLRGGWSSDHRSPLVNTSRLIANRPLVADDWYYSLVFNVKAELADENDARTLPGTTEVDGHEINKRPATKVMPQRTSIESDFGYDNLFELDDVVHYPSAVSKLSLGQKVVLHAEVGSPDDCSGLRVATLGSDETIGYISKAQCSIDPNLSLRARRLVRCGKGIARISSLDLDPNGAAHVTINIQLDDISLRYIRMITQLDDEKLARRKRSNTVAPTTVQISKGLARDADRGADMPDGADFSDTASRKPSVVLVPAEA